MIVFKKWIVVITNMWIVVIHNNPVDVIHEQKIAVTLLVAIVIHTKQLVWSASRMFVVTNE